MYFKIIKESIQTGGIIYTVHKIVSHAVNLLLEPWYKTRPLEQNTILFSSFPDYSDNARALYDYMVSMGLNQKYELIWVTNNKNSNSRMKRLGIKCISRHAIFPHNGMHRFYYYGRRAKWYFHTHGHPFIHGGYPDQNIVYLCHGGMGFKAGKGITSHISADTSRYTIISGSGEVNLTSIFAHQKCSKGSLLPLGMPRNDLLFKSKSIELLDSISGKKIIWMPTFRQSSSEYISSPTILSETGLPIIHTCKMVDDLNNYLQQIDIHIFIKPHPLQVLDKITMKEMSHIHFLTNEDLEKIDVQLYEILNHFDAMITDYSSVSFDYLHLNRPLGYTLDDIEEYTKSRGFAMKNPREYMPGMHIYTYDDLIHFISDIYNNIDEYEYERERVRIDVGIPQGGNCCQNILDFFDIS